MAKISIGRITAILFFLMLVVGAVFSLQKATQDIYSGNYFRYPEKLHFDISSLVSYILITIFILRYGYYLAINRVTWGTIKDDFLYLLNRRYFTKVQWILNVLLFWLSLTGFVYYLAISAMKGSL